MASFVTSTRYGISHPFRKGESSVCAPLLGTVQYLLGTRSYESVTSWRGPKQNVKIGTKLRKEFHPFRSFKFIPTPDGGPKDWLLCGSRKAAYYEMMPLSVFNPSTVQQARDLGPKYWEGVPPYISEADLAALGNSLRDFAKRDIFVKANSPRFNGAVFLAELDETLVGVKDLLKGAFGALAKANGIAKAVKHFSLNSEELWLWWRYALMPAMLDAEELLKAIKPPKVVDRVQDGSAVEETISGVALSKRWTSELITAEMPWSCSYRVGYGAAMDILSKHDTSPWGFSAWDTVMAGWERIPFSFIADWFLNLGDFLASLRDANVDIAQSYASYAVDVTTKIHGQGQLHMSELTLRSVLIDRVVAIEPPRLPLVDKRWRNLNRTIDGITLIVGMLKSVLKRRRH